MKVAKDLNIKVSGEYLITILCNRLNDNGIMCHDTNIVRMLRTLKAGQLWQIISFGDVQKWHNERVNKQLFESVEDENGFI